MTDSIFVLKPDGQLEALELHGYVSEDRLQELLASYPELLAGNQIDLGEGRRWILVSREVSVPASWDGGGRWSVDHLFIDQDAIPTLVEVKQSSATRLRREVVGQLLEYAANAVTYWAPAYIRQRFEDLCEGRGEEPEVFLSQRLGWSADYASFWDLVKTNLQAGRVRLLFVADEVPTELRRIVEFLNEQMDRTVVPRLLLQPLPPGRANLPFLSVYPLDGILLNGVSGCPLQPLSLVTVSLPWPSAAARISRGRPCRPQLERG